MCQKRNGVAGRVGRDGVWLEKISPYSMHCTELGMSKSEKDVRFTLNQGPHWKAGVVTLGSALKQMSCHLLSYKGKDEHLKVPGERSLHEPNTALEQMLVNKLVWKTWVYNGEIIGRSAMCPLLIFSTHNKHITLHTIHKHTHITL